MSVERFVSIHLWSFSTKKSSNSEDFVYESGTPSAALRGCCAKAQTLNQRLKRTKSRNRFSLLVYMSRKAKILRPLVFQNLQYFSDNKGAI
jgi:hypothetical protein